MLHTPWEYISESLQEVAAYKILVKVESCPHPIKDGDNFIPCILNLSTS
jgi:hypothetical protein